MELLALGSSLAAPPKFVAIPNQAMAGLPEQESPTALAILSLASESTLPLGSGFRLQFRPIESGPVPSSELAIALQEHGTTVIMEACELSSRRWVETTACAVLLAPGIVG